ncbi:MAG: coenzyme F420 hydrogenase/dehydrogenase beta subunit N-terminal domain-containing protein [Dehalococcoidia bacterium]
MAIGKLNSTFQRLKKEVIDAGLCTHCGTCVGLSASTLIMVRTPSGPLPRPADGKSVELDPVAYTACPGKGINYPVAYVNVFGQLPESWLVGNQIGVYVGYSKDPYIRRNAASGGIITQSLVYLLEQGIVDGAVVVRQGYPTPWSAEPVIAQTRDEILAASQSVYIPTSTNTILAEMERFNGRLAYVGLPDQVASVRTLQRLGHPATSKVDYVFGPYVGTGIYIEAIESYLRSNGVSGLDEVTELRYREGEWPGYLQVKTRSGKVLKANKFYYNYLTPFYITQSSLLSVDFTNELTDISVGDAWHPRYESQGGGYSVVLARSEQGESLLRDMQVKGLVDLEELTLEDAIAMHSHMLDFKKRGTFIRLRWRQALGKRVPDYGYRPNSIPWSRYVVEALLVSLFAVCSTRTARRTVRLIPLSVIGPIFDIMRRGWKRASKPTKRKGLMNSTFEEYTDLPKEEADHSK